MIKPFKTYTFDECYVPVKYSVLMDEEKDLLVQISSESFVVPEVDNSILHALNRFLSDQTGGLSANMIRKNSQISTN